MVLERFWSGALVYFLGVAWRAYFQLVSHPASHYLNSDSGSYYDTARKIASGEPLNIFDAFYPPGMSLFLAALGDTHRAELAMFGLSCLLPLLLAGLGWQLFGKRVAMLALTFSSLYFPFIDYGAYFLSEIPFTVLMLSSLLCLNQSLRGRRATAWGLLAGLTLGLACAFRNLLLVPALLTAGCLLMGSRLQRWQLPTGTLVGVLVGAAVILIPISARATRINEGHFCLVSTNWAINVMQGHSGQTGRFKFRDQERDLEYDFANVGALERGKDREIILPFGPYDTHAIMKFTWETAQDDPLAFLLASLENVYGFFWGTTPTPPRDIKNETEADREENEWLPLSQGMLLVLVLLPAGIYLLARAPRLLRLDPHLQGDLLITLPIVGMMMICFVTESETRFRIPFDTFLILLAARGWTTRPWEAMWKEG